MTGVVHHTSIKQCSWFIPLMTHTAVLDSIQRIHCSQQIHILGRVLFIVSQLAFHLQFDFSTLQLADLALYPTPSMVCAATNAQGPLPTSQLFCPCTEIVALCNGLTGFSVCLELVSDERTTYETIWDLA